MIFSMIRRHSSVLCGALVLASLPALSFAADPPGPGQPISVDTVREDFVLLSDGKEHYIAVLPVAKKRAKDFDYPIFYGDGKRLHAQRSTGYSANGEQYSYRFLDPRLTQGTSAEGEGWLEYDGKSYSVTCEERKTALSVVDKDKAATLLKTAAFVKGPRKFRPYALLRDTKGVYYYVDRGVSKDTEKQFRLFAGPKGNLKLQKMTNVVSDSEGDVFATKTGSLRLILNKSEASWMIKEKGQKLTIVPVDFNRNVAMIYNELGVYTGERLGTPCDDL